MEGIIRASLIDKIYISSARGVLKEMFFAALQEADYDLSFLLMPDTYDTTFGFVQTESYLPRYRNFYVSFNDNLRLEAYDVYDVVREHLKAFVDFCRANRLRVKPPSVYKTYFCG